MLLTGTASLAWAYVGAPEAAHALVVPAAVALAGSALGRWPWTGALSAGITVALATFAAVSESRSGATALAVQSLLMLGYLHALCLPERPAGRAADNAGKRRVDIVPAVVVVLATVVVSAATALPAAGGWPAAVAGAGALAAAGWDRDGPTVGQPPGCGLRVTG